MYIIRVCNFFVMFNDIKRIYLHIYIYMIKTDVATAESIHAVINIIQVNFFYSKTRGIKSIELKGLYKSYLH